MGPAIALWRAAAVGRSLADVLELARPVLAGLGVRQTTVWLLDRERLRAEVLASDLGELPAGKTHALDEAQLASLIDWCRSGEAERLSSARKKGEPSVSLGPAGALLVPLLTRGPGTTPEAAREGALVLVTGRGPRATDDAALRDLVAQPFAAALGHDRERAELERLKAAFEADKHALLSKLERHDLSESVVGAETGLREVVQRVAQVAGTDVPVLILGETGSGKEVVSRQIHAQSRRASGPMVRVNCGAIPSELVDSELFGHEAGSFTGAAGTKKGWFERADGGTLFLDEIGELPLAAQVRLLRVLQDGVLERVGGQKALRVDVRIIAATHRDLEAMVEAGGFRRDLWYRIGVFPIRLPALRDRPEDIPTLAAHFARRAAKRLGGPPLQLSPEDVALLVSYDWPGNVRELAAVIERAAILGGGARLELGAALGRSGPERQGRPARGELVHDRHGGVQAGDATLGDAMRRHIEAALQKCYGRIEGPFGAARALDVNPHTLRARMRKLGIEWRRYRAATVR